MVGLAVHLLGFPAIWNPELPVIFLSLHSTTRTLIMYVYSTAYKHTYANSTRPYDEHLRKLSWQIIKIDDRCKTKVVSRSLANNVPA